MAIADYFTDDVSQGDVFLISSDGFHSGVDINRINDIFGSCRRLHEIKKSILTAINDRKENGEKDNITALAVMAI